MNIQAQLFRTLNTVKYNAEHWSKLLVEFNEKIEKGGKANELDAEIFYNATFYEGATYFGKIFIKIYQGEYGDQDVEFWNKRLGGKVV